MRFANGQSVCLLWKSWLWMAGGLIDLHYHVLLLNLEGRMHKNRWWPINLQPPHRSASVPARRISKFILLKNQFLLSLSVAWSSGRIQQSVSKIIWPNTRFLSKEYLVFINRRLTDRARSFAVTLCLTLTLLVRNRMDIFWVVYDLLELYWKVKRDMHQSTITLWQSTRFNIWYAFGGHCFLEDSVTSITGYETRLSFKHLIQCFVQCFYNSLVNHNSQTRDLNDTEASLCSPQQWSYLYQLSYTD